MCAVQHACGILDRWRASSARLRECEIHPAVVYLFWSYQIAWRPRRPPDGQPADQSSRWLILADRHGLADLFDGCWNPAEVLIRPGRICQCSWRPARRRTHRVSTQSPADQEALLGGVRGMLARSHRRARPPRVLVTRAIWRAANSVYALGLRPTVRMEQPEVRGASWIWTLSAAQQPGGGPAGSSAHQITSVRWKTRRPATLPASCRLSQRSPCALAGPPRRRARLPAAAVRSGCRWRAWLSAAPAICAGGRARQQPRAQAAIS